MSERGFSRTFLQCREKLKKMKSEYRQVKGNNNTSGAGRKHWKWFDLLDQIYGHRPANVGREGGLDSATALLESLQDDYIGTSEEEHNPTRPQTPAEEPTPTQPPTPSAITTPQRVVLGKRKRGGEDRTQQERHHEQHMAQQKRHLDWAKASAERRWELDAALRREEAALRREEATQAENFNLAFLRTLGGVLGGLGSRRGSLPSSLCEEQQVQLSEQSHITSDPVQTSSDPVPTSSDGLCKLVRWAHSHGTFCSLLPSLQQLTSHGTALTTQPGSHGSSVPVAVWSCADGHAYNWSLGEHSNANGGSGHTSNGQESFVGGRPSNKVTVKASCDLSYSEAASQGEQFSSGCDSSATAEDDYEPHPSRKRGGATGVALPVKKVKQEADSAEDCDSGIITKWLLL
nr:uncharacterized protein LOC117456614 isoform X1 [Pseudochaenichthys georgianus]